MHRLVITLLLIGAALLPAGCTPQAIHSTISCPVYQPPETPHPEWPKECGGQR